MAKKKPTSVEGQYPLFLVDDEKPENPVQQTWQEIEEDPALQLQALVGDNIGPHNDVIHRAERLVEVMNALAHRNMLLGLDVAVYDGRYKQPIWVRYLDGTPSVINKSRSKVERLQAEAENNFWHATGFEALRGSGLITGNEVGTRMAKMWRDFNTKYGSPAAEKERNRYRRSQTGLLPKTHPLRKKKKRGQKDLEQVA
jgi:hypothetical protein